eukprot:134791_1
MGRQIGVGKESDVFEAFGPKDITTDIAPKYVLKLHRLGRISFRTVKNKRDYLKNNKYGTKSYGSWLYLSRLSALKEYGFMKILHDKKFPVPKDITTDIAPKYVLKLHRLGRISFRTVKNKRDYLKNNKYGTKSYGSWLYLSRLSALKEYGFMKILHDKKFPVPKDITTD